MTLFEIRLKNLRQLIDDRFDGVAGRLAETIGRQPAYVYRLFTDRSEHRRNIGEELARDIESKLELPPGSLDKEFPYDGEAQNIANRYEQSGDGKRDAMKTLAELPEAAAADIQPILDALKSKYKIQ